jgi:hypothetical protein
MLKNSKWLPAIVPFKSFLKVASSSVLLQRRRKPLLKNAFHPPSPFSFGEGLGMRLN